MIVWVYRAGSVEEFHKTDFAFRGAQLFITVYHRMNKNGAQKLDATIIKNNYKLKRDKQQRHHGHELDQNV